MIALREIAHALGGEIVGAQVLAPGPAHDRRDRSLSVKISASSPDGFLVHSFAGDDFKVCRDHVKSRLGLPNVDNIHDREPERPTGTSAAGPLRIERALEIWRPSVDPRGTVVEGYLRSRALDLDADIAGAVLRFNPRCPWRDEQAGETIFVPAMIAAMRSIAIDEITAVHRTRLSFEGRKLDRRMLGIVAGAAIKLDPDETVTHGLHVGEGVESCMSARQLGLRPTWALGSTSNIAAFPVLSGIECLTILGENDDASAKAVQGCGERWYAAGRIVLINRAAFERCNPGVVMNASTSAFTVENLVPANEGGRVKAPIKATPFVWIDPASIPRRQWLYGRHYIRKFISETVAPGGYGKSTLAMTEGLAIVTGRPLLNVTPDERANVWIWNGEDPLEELQRRIMAAVSTTRLTGPKSKGGFSSTLDVRQK